MWGCDDLGNISEKGTILHYFSLYLWFTCSIMHLYPESGRGWIILGGAPKGGNFGGVPPLPLPSSLPNRMKPKGTTVPQ